MNQLNHQVSSIDNRESSYLRAYKAPVFCLLFSVLCHLHLSRTPYKSTHFMQNKPNLVRRRRVANERKFHFNKEL